MATLLDVATPGPVLLKTYSSIGATPAFGWFTNTQTTFTTAGTYYNASSISLTAGTWLVIGLCSMGTGTPVAVLNTVSGASGNSNSWTVQTGGVGTSSAVCYQVVAVIKVTTTTTVYLNAKSTAASDTGYGAIYAGRIA